MLNPALFEKNSLELVSTRKGYGEGVLEAGKQDENVVVLTADLKVSTYSHLFAEAFPERFFDVGVAEQNMAGIAAGLALSGKVPFMASYGVFSPGRNWEQVRVSICYSDANVKVVGSHGGLSVGADGATHQALEDIALVRCLPGMTVVVPCDYFEAKKATLALAQMKGPAYLRLARAKTPVLTKEKDTFEIGKAQVWQKGADILFIACGPILYEVILAARELETRGKSCGIINCATVKPLDEKTILKEVEGLAENGGMVVTVEDHQRIGGLGSAIAELLGEHAPVKMKILGVDDRFGESGSYEELLAKYGLNAKGIVEVVLS